MHINPYDLLGVTIHSSMDELKKAYYSLSLLMHPDKGGSAEDMVTLHRAYNFVRRELQSVNHDITVEQLEDEFRTFCVDQTQEVPKFQDIYAEAFELEKFNKYFDNQDNQDNVWKPFYAAGYGDLMEEKDMSVEYSANVEGDIKHHFQAMAVYKDPEELITSSLSCVDYTHMDKSDRFTCVPCYDYQEAFSASPAKPDKVDDVAPRTLEGVMQEREALDMPRTTGEYIWSSFGLHTADGKRITNFLQIQ